jgi:DnaJ-domain-containing protein 1
MRCRKRILKRQWVKDNPDKVRAKKRRYNAKNKERRAAYKKEWQKNNPDKVRATTRRVQLNAHAKWREMHMIENV